MLHGKHGCASKYPRPCQGVLCCSRSCNQILQSQRQPHWIQDRSLTLEELQYLFACGGFNLHQLNSSEYAVLKTISLKLCDAEAISDPGSGFARTLGIKCDIQSNDFGIYIADPTHLDIITKCTDIAIVYDLLVWFIPVTITIKIFLQRL